MKPAKPVTYEVRMYLREGRKNLRNNTSWWDRITLPADATDLLEIVVLGHLFQNGFTYPLPNLIEARELTANGRVKKTAKPITIKARLVGER